MCYNTYTHVYSCICDSVTGEANFTTPTTRLTIGGFNQPTIARTLIESPRNAEKGLSQRFLWLFPKPMCTTMKELEPINLEFYNTLGKVYLNNNHMFMRFMV